MVSRVVKPAMLEYQAKPVGVKLFSYVNASFGIIASHGQNALYKKTFSVSPKIPGIIFAAVWPYQEIGQIHSIKLTIIFLNI